VTCTGADDDTFMDGDEKKINATLSPNAQSADVIFVIEEKRCLINAATIMADMGVQIDNALKARGRLYTINSPLRQQTSGSETMSTRKRSHVLCEWACYDAI
jgi:hypothetical protein